MSEGMRGTLVLERQLDEGLVDRVLAAVADAKPEERLSAALEAVVEIADSDPQEARAALWELRGDPATLKHLEGCLQGGADRATLALGAAIQLAGAELSSPAPDLRGRLPELLRWLEAAW